MEGTMEALGPGERADYERLFLSELSTIQAALQSVGRRYCLPPEQVEELASEVHLKIIDDDYAVLRKFQWRSSLQTYLTVVVNRVYLDGLVKARGKWRSSAAARRSGPAAVKFERLVTRDGLSFDQACRVLQHMDRVPVDTRALARLAADMPARMVRHYVSADALEQIQSRAGDPALALLEADRIAAIARASEALAAELAALSEEDRLLVRRRFTDGARLLDVARETAQAPRIVYRRVARLLAVLRRRLERRGISPFDVAELLHG
jgi:DNA-directed RNA polymerase specialized sigma24 family protein